MPVVYTFILYRNKDVLDNEAIKNKIGSLYVGIHTKNFVHYMYTTIFLLRRLVYVLLLVSLQEAPVLFSQGLIVLNMMYLYYLVFTKPHDSQSSLVMEIFNEVLLQLISYHLLFTGFRNDYRKWVDESD